MLFRLLLLFDLLFQRSFLPSRAAQSCFYPVLLPCVERLLLLLTRLLREHLASRNIRINALAPGVVETKQSKAFLSLLSPEQVDNIRREHLLGFGQPEDIAGVIRFFLSEDSRWITGQTLAVDGGLTIH